MTIIRTIRLSCREGKRDAVYILYLELVEDGRYKVITENGRRGSSLTRREKTPAPVTLAEALKIIDKQVKKETSEAPPYHIDSDSYEGGAAVGPVMAPAPAREDTGLRPMLPYEIDEETAQRLLVDRNWGLQVKYNGENVPIEIEVPRVTAANKAGLARPLPESLVEDLRRIKADKLCRFYTELVGPALVAHDCTAFDGHDMRSRSYLMRYDWLQYLPQSEFIMVAPLWVETLEKVREYNRLRDTGAEGVIFKRLDSPFVEGESRATCKRKFWEHLHVVVTHTPTGKRSVNVAVFSPSLGWETVCAVTIGGAIPLPEPGSVIDIRYLHALKNEDGSASIIQGTYIRPRPDLGAQDCLHSRIKFFNPKAA